jgi:hypothetical protein
VRAEFYSKTAHHTSQNQTSRSESNPFLPTIYVSKIMKIYDAVYEAGGRFWINMKRKYVQEHAFGQETHFSPKELLKYDEHCITDYFGRNGLDLMITWSNSLQVEDPAANAAKYLFKKEVILVIQTGTPFYPASADKDDETPITSHADWRHSVSTIVGGWIFLHFCPSFSTFLKYLAH